jgi:hypothetical protein
MSRSQKDVDLEKQFRCITTRGRMTISFYRISQTVFIALYRKGKHYAFIHSRASHTRAYTSNQHLHYTISSSSFSNNKPSRANFCCLFDVEPQVKFHSTSSESIRRNLLTQSISIKFYWIDGAKSDADVLLENFWNAIIGTSLSNGKVSTQASGLESIRWSEVERFNHDEVKF